MMILALARLDQETQSPRLHSVCAPAAHAHPCSYARLTFLQACLLTQPTIYTLTTGQACGLGKQDQQRQDAQSKKQGVPSSQAESPYPTHHNLRPQHSHGRTITTSHLQKLQAAASAHGGLCNAGARVGIALLRSSVHICLPRGRIVLGPPPKQQQPRSSHPAIDPVVCRGLVVAAGEQRQRRLGATAAAAAAAATAAAASQPPVTQ